MRDIRVDMEQRSIYRFWLLVTQVQHCQAEFFIHRFGRPHHGWKLMTVIGRREGLTASEVSVQTDLELDKVTRIADQLIRKGLISRRQNPKDNRAVQLSLTPNGRRAYKELYALRRALELEFLSALTASERETLYGFLDRLQERAQSMYQGKDAWRRFVPESYQKPAKKGLKRASKKRT